jgi:cytochrome c-type protein NapC
MKDGKRGALGRCWNVLTHPSAKYSVLFLLVLGVVLGIVFWGGFNTALEATNRLEFCVSCHEMRDTVYVEYQQSIHYKNRTGVRAICSDCHVPKDWTHKMARKMRASLELWGKLTGEVDTPAKFEANRMRLATDEWERMKTSQSRECRNCHSFDGMDARKQSSLAQKNHTQAKAEGKTCIDCHKGIAHLLPKEYRDPSQEE